MTKWHYLLPLVIVLLAGCHDYRYDECAKNNPITVDYLKCVKAFQDQDDEDAADVAAINAANSAAIIVTTMN